MAKAASDEPSATGLSPCRNPGSMDAISVPFSAPCMPNESARYTSNRWCSPSSADSPIIPMPMVSAASIPYGTHMDMDASCMWCPSSSIFWMCSDFGPKKTMPIIRVV